MRQEVIDFFKSNKTPVERIVSVGVRRRGLTADSIRSASESVYDDIRDGNLVIKPIQIVWEVYKRSSHGSTPSNNASVYDALVRLEGKFDEYTTPWYKKFWRKFK